MSASAEFKEFVERQQRSSSAAANVDWAKERDEWLGYLQQLYDSISEYLAEYIENDAIKIRETKIDLIEENIGAYAAKRLTILIGAQEIHLIPVGTLLIGTKGRVDVEGSAGKSRLLLINKNVTDSTRWGRITLATTPPEGGAPPAVAPSAKKIEWVWKIASRPPATHFIELNRETFLEMLLEVSNG